MLVRYAQTTIKYLQRSQLIQSCPTKTLLYFFCCVMGLFLNIKTVRLAERWSMACERLVCLSTVGKAAMSHPTVSEESSSDVVDQMGF